MAAAGYSVVSGGKISISTSAKTILGVKAHANSGLQLKGFSLAFDGVTASAVPILVEIGYCTFGANAPGTNSTSVTPAQTYGRVLTAGFTAGKNWTTEPTTITAIKEFLVAPDKGLFAYQFPLGQEPDTALGEGLCIRVTAPAANNVSATMDVERI